MRDKGQLLRYKLQTPKSAHGGLSRMWAGKEFGYR